MNIDTFLKFFVPKDHSYYPLFESDTKNLLKATELLKELMESTDPVVHEKLYIEIQHLEHIGDDITYKTYEQLNKSFITPFDRDDIHELMAHIDDVVDSINGISRRLCLYRPKKMIPAYSQLADLIFKAAQEIETAILCLNDPIINKLKITTACERVNALEHAADEIYFEGALELFEMENDTKELLKNNKILEILETCVDQEEDITDTLKTILIKMA